MTLIRMFLLSRRSAAFALFVILAFATSTLLALLTEEQRSEAMKLCFDYDGTKWYHEVMAANIGDGKFDGDGIVDQIEFGLVMDSAGRMSCLVWKRSEPKLPFIVHGPSTLLEILNTDIEDVATGQPRTFVSLKAMEEWTNRIMVIEFDIYRGYNVQLVKVKRVAVKLP
eukprot:GHVS01098632.1.p1 GENE.GHVS01098632.1~~GHVS01098632.1.p1  ORF type:complete len:169 (-),score=17.99 GHVS01098632.1:133-639(-)